MKIPQFALLFLFGLLSMAILPGCKDECKKVDCVNGACVEGNCLCNAGWTGTHCDQVDKCYQRTCINGYCADGSCVCDALYEDNTCSSPVNQKFIGNWAVNETCTLSGSNGYSVIVAGVVGSLDHFRIANIWAQGTVNAIVGSDYHTFTVAKQAVGAGYQIGSTSATISTDGRTIAIAYNVYDANTNALIESCTATWEKY